MFQENFIGKQESNLVFSHLPGGHKIRANGETKEHMMSALTKQQTEKKKKKKKKKKKQKQ